MTLSKKDFSNRRRPFSFLMKGINEKEYRPGKNEDDILIIQSSSVGTTASRRYNSTQTNYTEHNEWDNSTGEYSQEICSNTIHADGESTSTTTLETSTLEKEMDALMNRFSSRKTKGIPTIQERLDSIRDLQQQSLDYLLRILFGDERQQIGGCNKIDRTTTPGEKSANNPVTKKANELGQHLGTGWSHYSFYHYEENETTCFDTTGTAITADGRQLSFNISLEMSRSFVEMTEEKIDFGQPRLCDPLVINLNTNVASVSDQKFFFDIDADGKEEKISMLHKDSGYLALDNNDDGVINDGSELFGTQSGNGFKDLVSHDEDGNGWIDEADSIFQKLKIWIMDESGNSKLIDLKEAGLGAIYLGYENTEFSLKDSTNKTNAVIQKTGLFLYENGMSGTVQQMDLAV